MQRHRVEREAEDRDDRPEDFVQSVGRALRVLEVVGEQPGLPVKTIARKSGLNISTTYHLVRTLAYEGYLARMPNGTYLIGNAVALRFHDLLDSFGKPPDSTTVLRHLSERTGLSAYLGCIRSGQVTVIEVVEGPGSPYLEEFEAGLGVAAHATALGKVLLSAMSGRERRRYLRDQGLRPFTTHTRTDAQQLDDELSAAPAGEALVEHGEFREDVSCAGSLVRRADANQTPWAIVVSTHGEDVPASVCAEILLAAGDLSAPVGA